MSEQEGGGPRPEEEKDESILGKKTSRRSFLKSAGAFIAGKTIDRALGPQNASATSPTEASPNTTVGGRLPAKREREQVFEFKEINYIDPEHPSHLAELYHENGWGQAYPLLGSEYFSGESSATISLNLQTHAEEEQWSEFKFSTQSSHAPQEGEIYKQASLLISTDNKAMLKYHDGENLLIEDLGSFFQNDELHLTVKNDRISAKIGEDGEEISIEAANMFQNGDIITPIIQMPGHSQADISRLTVRHRDVPRETLSFDPPTRELTGQHGTQTGAAIEQLRRFTEAGYKDKRGFDPRYDQLILEEMDMIIDKAACGWGWVLRPQQGEINTFLFDTGLQYAKEHDKKYRAYLVSTGNYKTDPEGNITSSAMPDWVHDLQEKNGEFSEQAKQVIKKDFDDYLEAMIDRGAGQVDEWICGSELIYNGQDSRNNVWIKVFEGKENFVRHTFNKVRSLLDERGDHNAKLILMFDGGEGINDDQSDAVYNFAKNMKEQGVSIDMLGMEAHFKSGSAPTEDEMVENIERIERADMEAIIAEHSYDGPENERIANMRIMARVIKRTGIPSFVRWPFVEGHKTTSATGNDTGTYKADYTPTNELEAFREELAA